MVKKYEMKHIRTYSMSKWMTKSRISVIQQVVWVIIDPEMHQFAKTSCRLHRCTFFSVSKKADFLSSDMTYEKKYRGIQASSNQWTCPSWSATIFFSFSMTSGAGVWDGTR